MPWLKSVDMPCKHSFIIIITLTIIIIRWLSLMQMYFMWAKESSLEREKKWKQGQRRENMNERGEIKKK